MKIGIVGLDTSHVVAFSQILNDDAHEYHIPAARIVAAFPGGSEAFSLSRHRLQGYSDDLRTRFGVAMRDSIAEVAEEVDAIFLESVDGRQHLEQFRQLALGKPVFIDKPLATSTADARAIIDLARQTSTPIMSCSSLRYAAGIADLNPAAEQVVSCEAFGPARLLDDYPGLFWYGIHSAEILVTFLGPSCRRVRCLSYPTTDAVIGEWADGRLGVMRGTRFDKGDFGCVLHTASGARCGLAAAKPPMYHQLLAQVVPFLRTGQSPIPVSDMFAVIAFIEAADQSKARSGEAVALPEL